MAQFFLSQEQLPIALQIRALADNELLDFWEETQSMEQQGFNAESTLPDAPAEYEQMILRELRLRRCQRLVSRT